MDVITYPGIIVVNVCQLKKSHIGQFNMND